MVRACVCVHAVRSWTNVWHITFTKYTQMSVLQSGGCLNMFVCQLCGTLFTYILIAITRNLSGNRSQTPISSYNMHNSRLGVRFQHTPYVCILKSWCFASLAVSAMVTDYIRSSLWITTTNRTAKTHCVIMRASIYKHTVACGCKLLHPVAVTKHLSLRNSPLSPLFTTSPVVEAKFLLGLEPALGPVCLRLHTFISELHNSIISLSFNSD